MQQKSGPRLSRGHGWACNCTIVHPGAGHKQQQKTTAVLFFCRRSQAYTNAATARQRSAPLLCRDVPDLL